MNKLLSKVSQKYWLVEIEMAIIFMMDAVSHNLEVVSSNLNWAK